MGLEDIPEVQVLNDDLEPINWTNIGFGVEGKFIVVQGPDKKHYVFAIKHSFVYSAHQDLDGAFRETLSDTYSVNPEIFSTIGGGKLDINRDGIFIYDESDTYGKYDEASVRPLIERFVQSRRDLPSTELTFE